MILVDSNVFMYAVGSEHPHKRPTARWLKKMIEESEEIVTDAEVLQEILHRYWAIGRVEQGRKVYDLARRSVPVVLPIRDEDTDMARLLLDRGSDVSARDALHVAVALHHRVEAICSYDSGLDTLDEIARIEPE